MEPATDMTAALQQMDAFMAKWLTTVAGIKLLPARRRRHSDHLVG